MNTEHVGIRPYIASVMMHKGISQYKLAKLSGVGRVTINSFLSGDVDMRISTLSALLKALEIETSFVSVFTNQYPDGTKVESVTDMVAL
jgi:transcriptional regulator with XRE-family HTH domain